MKIKHKILRLFCIGVIVSGSIPMRLFAPSASSIAVVSQVDLEELRHLRQEVKYLRDELRKEAAAAKSAREEAKRYFDALVKLK